MTAGQDRLQGWCLAMRAAGLPDDAVEHGDFTEAGGERAGSTATGPAGRCASHQPQLVRRESA